MGHDDHPRTPLQPGSQIRSKPFRRRSIERGKRLVQQDNARSVQQGAGDCGSLEQTPAQAPGQFRRPVAESGGVQRRIGNLTGLIERIEAGSKGKVFPQGEVVVEQRLMGEEANRAASAVRATAEPMAQNPDFPGARAQEPGESLRRVVLPAPLGPMMASASPEPEREVQAAQDAGLAEGALEPVSLEKRDAVMRRHRSARRARRGGRV